MPLTVKRSDTTPYSFTLRKVKSPTQVCKEDYDAHLAKFTSQGVKLYDRVFENTSGLHCHGTLGVPKKFNMKKFRVRGWSMVMCEVYDSWGWTQYLLKDQAPTKDVNDPDNDPLPKRKLF